MKVLEKLKDYICHEQLFAPQDRILLAVSGGKDSMLMAFLFKKLDIEIAIAHCNFQLRGEEALKDEQLVQQFAQDHQIPFFVAHFQTEEEAKRKGISIQMAARELRYEWFQTLAHQHHYDKIAVAQHQNDHLETVLLHLTRGTGLRGLMGIYPKRNNIIRPLLFLTADQIADHVQKYAVPYRDDQSNFSPKYARNRIRLHIIPEFKKITTDFEEVFAENIQHFKESFELLQSFIQPLRDKLFHSEGHRIIILKNDLATYIDNLPLLYELFIDFGFTKAVLSDLQKQWNQQSGKLFLSPTHALLQDREQFILSERTAEASQHDINEITWDNLSKPVKWKNNTLHAQVTEDKMLLKNGNIAQLDFEKIVLPLYVRSWQEGDYFVPFGMRGKKKLSDFFVSQKINVFDKQRIPVVVNGNGEIIWVATMRMDNRYRITENTKKILILECE